MATREEIRSELQRLQDNGRLSPEHIVEAAQAPDSILHDQFDWNNISAGHKYRLTQAAALIRRIKLRVRTSTVRSIIPLYVQDTGAVGKGFISLNSQELDLIDARATVENEIRRLEGNYRRSLGVVAALDSRFPGNRLLDDFLAHMTDLIMPHPGTNAPGTARPAASTPS